MYAAGKNNHGTQSEQLGSLNSRFAMYIEKVRYLEEQNRILEIKIKAASKRKSEIEKNEGNTEGLSQNYLTNMRIDENYLELFFCSFKILAF